MRPRTRAREFPGQTVAAKALGGIQGQQLAAAGQKAFSASHSVVLLTAAALVGALSLLVWFVLKHHKSQ